MNYFLCGCWGPWNEDCVSIQLSHLVAAMRTHTSRRIHTTCTVAHRSVKQCALIKHSHYTQEEIPAGAVYQSLVHFLLLLTLLPFYVLCPPLPALFTLLT